MSAISDGISAGDRWLRGPLAGDYDIDGVWLARARGIALAGAAFTLAMSAWKAIGPISTADLFLIAAVLLLLPRFDPLLARRFWFPALAVALIAVGGVIGTFVVSSSEVADSADVLVRFALASFGALLLIACWRPSIESIKAFAWLWVAGGIVSAFVAFTIPDLHMFLRPSGLTPHPTHLGLISLILFGVALGLAGSERRPVAVWPGLVAAAILFAAIAVSGSRAGLGAAAIVAILVLAATRERVIGWARGHAAAAVVIVIAAVAALAVFSFTAGNRSAFDRLLGGSEVAGSDADRDVRNELAWDTFKAEPLTGAGFADAVDPHNFFLQAGSAAGVLGLAGAAMLVVLALWSYWIAGWRRMSEDPPYWAMAAALAAAMIGYLFISNFQNVLWDRNIWVGFALMTWACAAFPGGAAAAGEGPAH